MITQPDQLSPPRLPAGINLDHLILGMFFICFYVGTLGLYPLTVPDEGRYPSIAMAMLTRHDYIDTMLNGVLFMDKPALFYWLEALSMRLFGINEWSIRLPVALISIFGILLTQRIGAIFYGRRTGWLAGLILGTSLLYYVSSHYAAMDMEVAVWISASLFFTMLGLQQSANNKRRLMFYSAYAFAALAMLTKGLIGIVFPAMILGIYILLLRQWRLIKMIFLPSGLCLFFALSAPWFILMQIRHPDFFYHFFVYQQFIRFTQSGFNNSLPFWFYLPVILLGLFPWSVGIVSALKHAFKKPHKDLITFYLWIWIVSIFVFFSMPDSKPVTYIMPVFPPLALLLAKEINRWFDKRKMSVAFGISSIITILVGIATLFTNRMAEHMSVILPEKSLLYFSILGGVLIITGIMMFIFFVKRAKKAIITTISASTASILILLSITAGTFNLNSSRHLALLIKDKITPETQIINYRQYFYDLPLYLHNQKPIIVVSDWKDKEKILASDNWRRELYLGMQQIPEASAWLIQPDKLHSTLTKPSYVFTHTKYADELLKHYPLHLVSTYGKIALLSN